MNAGEHASHYRIEAALGQDNAGNLYRARDLERDREVTLRAIDLQLLRIIPELRESLIRTRRLEHPGVVELLALERHEGLLLVAMTPFTVTRLDDWLREHDADWRRVLAMFIRVGEGLAAAHEGGLLHLGLYGHPQWLDSAGHPRVEGFGMYPRELGADHDYIWGNPTGTAPEQLRGHLPPDPRTDQFTYAFMLWEALHLQRPFRGDSVPELAGRVCAGELDEPSNTEVPDALRVPLRRALAPEPDRRWPDMRALLNELRALA